MHTPAPHPVVAQLAQALRAAVAVVAHAAIVLVLTAVAIVAEHNVILAVAVFWSPEWHGRAG